MAALGYQYKQLMLMLQSLPLNEHWTRKNEKILNLTEAISEKNFLRALPACMPSQDVIQ